MWTIPLSTLYLLWTTLQAHSKSVATQESGETDSSDCRPWLTTQIATCLMQFEDLLFVYQQPGTSESQRHDMVTGMCHAYEETLQCLHLSLLRCEPDIASLQVIASHLGPVRTFMEDTCYIAPRRVTPTPRGSPTPQESPTSTTVRNREPSTVNPADIATQNSGHPTEITHISTQLGSAHRVSDTSNPVTTPVNDAKRELRTNTTQVDANTDEAAGNLALTDGVSAASGIHHYSLIHLGSFMSVTTMMWLL